MQSSQIKSSQVRPTHVTPLRGTGVHKKGHRGLRPCMRKIDCFEKVLFLSVRFFIVDGCHMTSSSLRFFLSTVVLSYLENYGVSAQYAPAPPSAQQYIYGDPPPSPPNRPPSPAPPLRPPLSPGYTSRTATVCHNECAEWANDGVCDDGGPGSSYFACDLCAAPSPPELNPCVC